MLSSTAEDGEIEGGPRRVNHAAVCVGDRIYSFGGYCTGENYHKRKPIDVHILNTVTFRWTSLPVPRLLSAEGLDMPFQRYGHTVVALDNLIYLWGGRNDELACNVLYCLDTVTLKWSIPQVYGKVPGARDGHSACIIDHFMYIFGGFVENIDRFSQDVYMLDLLTFHWSYVSTQVRAGFADFPYLIISTQKHSKIQSISLISVNLALLPRECRAEAITCWDLTVLVIHQGAPPPYRDFHSATAVGRRMYVFGGRGDLNGPLHSQEEVYCNNIMYLDTATNRWHRPVTHGNTPIGRRSHSSCQYDCYKGLIVAADKLTNSSESFPVLYEGDLYVFGGYNGLLKEHYNDLHRFSPQSNKWCEVFPHGTPPSKRRRQSCLVVGRRLFLFGGTSPMLEAHTVLPVPEDMEPGEIEELMAVPLEEQGDVNIMEMEIIVDGEVVLMDHNDLHVMDFETSLTDPPHGRAEHGDRFVKARQVPPVTTKVLKIVFPRSELRYMTTNNTISRPINSMG
uniref:Kelch domain-containing protein 3 n=1 Tax=Timema genevievae TaxID=629358 RepID=A0A7R9JSG4_TIMGE|nr:unnamed protein product [Timema genevievae]